MDDSIHSGNSSMRGYLVLIRKDSSTHIHGLAVYVKKGLPFAQDLSLANSADSYSCFLLVCFTQCLTSFFSIDHLLHLYARFLILHYLTQMRVSQSTHLLCLSLNTLTSIIKTS